MLMSVGVICIWQEDLFIASSQRVVVSLQCLECIKVALEVQSDVLET